MRIVVIAALVLSSCAEEAQRVSKANETIEAVVEVDPSSGSKKFQGVWLVKGNGTRLLVAYRANRLWTSLAGKKVSATVERYLPKGQAISAPHVYVHKLELNTDVPVDYVEVGPLVEETYTLKRVSPGGNEKSPTPYWTLVSSHTVFLVDNEDAIGSELKEGDRLVVRARVVVRSPFVAHRGGPRLYLEQLRRATSE